MKFSSPSLFGAWARLARRVSLMLLPALASESLVTAALGAPAPRAAGSKLHAGSTRSVPSVPYLTLVLPPPLRFLEAPPPADTPSHLATVGPGTPGGPREELAAANRSAAVVAAGTPGAIAASAETQPVEDKTSVPLVPLKPVPPLINILPDDTPRDVGAEDVLPYFQFPGAPPSLPSPSALPPSSATYRQR